MPDGRALQSCTSHDLGQNFSKTLNISFQNKEGKNEFVWQNSWGFSTRSIGGLVLVHGDDNGLKIPPKLAPIKIAIIPIFGKKDDQILRYCQKIKLLLDEGVSEFSGSVVIFDDIEKSFGWRMNDAEIQGIPLRIEVGSREQEEKTVTLSFRVSEIDKKMARFEGLFEKVEECLTEIQEIMLQNSTKVLTESTHCVKDYEEFKKVMKTTRGFIKAFWCEDKNCEEKIKEETKASTRCKLLDAEKSNSKCVYCGEKAEYEWYFAQAY